MNIIISFFLVHPQLAMQKPALPFTLVDHTEKSSSKDPKQQQTELLKKHLLSDDVIKTECLMLCELSCLKVSDLFIIFILRETSV